MLKTPINTHKKSLKLLGLSIRTFAYPHIGTLKTPINTHKKLLGLFIRTFAHRHIFTLKTPINTHKKLLGLFIRTFAYPHICTSAHLHIRTSAHRHIGTWKKHAYVIVPVILLLLNACSPKGPYALTNKVYKNQADSFARMLQLEQAAVLKDSLGLSIPSEFVGSVNFGIRKANYVIIHYTAEDSLAQTLHTFTVKRTAVSAHYVVGKSGKVVHMVNDYLRAQHAGLGKWGSVIDMNSISIGIEIDNNGNEPFTDAQINSLLALLSYLKKAYTIPAANFIGHEDFAPKRKPDPGPFFPWKKLAEKGFGYWSDDVLEVAPDNFDYVTALRLIGYDTSDLNSAIVAFKRHFVQTDIKPKLTQLDLNILYNVYQKY